MRKLAVFAVILTYGLVSCQNSYNDTTIENKSSRTVTFMTAHSGPYTILAAESMTLDTVKNGYVKTYTPDKRVSYSRSGDYSSFDDLTQYPVNVINLTNETVNLSSGGWIEAEPLNVPANTTSASPIAGTIYTKKPNFSAVTPSGFPLQVDYTFDGNKFMVTVH
jgi:hypothetical protein